MDRFDGCAPLKGPEDGTFGETRYPGILGFFRHEKKRFLYRRARPLNEERHTFTTRTNDTCLLFIPLMAGGRNGK